MRTIVVASQKGGTGKTTVCSNLAVAAAANRFDRVVVVDADDQRSLTDWIRDRERNSAALKGSVRQLQLLAFEDFRAGRELAQEKGIEWLFIDTEPSTKSTAQAFIELADIVVVPVRPSLPDARSAGATFDLCMRLRKRVFAVLTMAKPRTVALREFAKRLRTRVPCADSVLYDRQAYPLAFALGMSVTETDPHDTGTHVRALLTEIDNTLAIPPTSVRRAG